MIVAFNSGLIEMVAAHNFYLPKFVQWFLVART